MSSQLLFHKFLRVALVSSLATITIFSLESVVWQAHFRTTTETIAIHLGEAPIWDPPVLPPVYSFPQLSSSVIGQRALAEGELRRVFWIEPIISELTGYFFLIGCLVSFFYLSTSGNHSDILLHSVMCLTIGCVLAFVANICLWFLSGGTSVPFPWLFCTLGVAFGLPLGIATFRRRPKTT